MDLHQRVAIVTGGGRAIGKAIALRLAGGGADVVVIGPVTDELEQAAAEIRSLGRQVLALQADVSEEEQVTAMADRTRQEFGRIDVLVNNAGIIGPTAPAHKISRAEWDEVLAVNLTGAFLCARAVVPTMIKQRRGKVINIASVAGKIAYALRSPYAVSKWGMIGLTLTLAKELGPCNIQVNAVCPGPVAGPRIQQTIVERAAELGQSAQEIERSYVESAALKRMVQEDDVAAIVAFLASDEANNITGQAIDISAGYGL